jgi:hypothetical protein
MKKILGLTLLFLLSCAQPKYVNEDGSTKNNSAHEAGSDCSIQFNGSQICLSWYWEKKPTSTHVGSFIFKTYRLNTFDATALELNPVSVPQVLLWMPSMGHGSTPTQTVQLDIGTYRAENVFFIMPGEWEIKFQIKDGDIVRDEAIILITL